MSALRLPAYCVLTLVSTAGLAQTCPPGNPLVAPTSRFAISAPVAGQNVVLDRETGLMWKQCSEGQSGNTCAGIAAQDDWQAALQRANTASHAGFDDWRLPNRAELLSIVETGCFDPAVDAIAFPNTEAQFYWTSTTQAAEPINAWAVNFGGGSEGALIKTDSLRRIRLVRWGASFDAFDSGETVFRNGYE
jgi:hypothetical protein